MARWFDQMVDARMMAMRNERVDQVVIRRHGK